MSDYHAVARTNYFKVIDLEGLKKAISDFDVTLITTSFHQLSPDAKFSLICRSEGGWSTLIHVIENDNVIDFDFHKHILPFVKEGEIVVAIESGSIGSNFMAGFSVAFIRNQDTIREVNISTEDIYDLAAKEFNVDRHSITTI